MKKKYIISDILKGMSHIFYTSKCTLLLFFNFFLEQTKYKWAINTNMKSVPSFYFYMTVDQCSCHPSEGMTCIFFSTSGP